MLESNRGCSELVEDGDYKFHRGDQNPQTDIKFSQIIHSFELTQHVSVATNKRNCTVDFIIITRSGDRLLQKRSQMGAGSAGYHTIRLFHRNCNFFLQNYLFLGNEYFSEKYHVNKHHPVLVLF